MKQLDKFERDILATYEGGKLKSISPMKADLAKFKAAASATFIKERRVNIRLSSPDLMDIQARALEEGLPYQTLIASVLRKYVAGRLIEKPSRLTPRTTRTRLKATRADWRVDVSRYNADMIPHKSVRNDLGVKLEVCSTNSTSN